MAVLVVQALQFLDLKQKLSFAYKAKPFSAHSVAAAMSNGSASSKMARFIVA
jgi:hypothetical protein